jgi:hypothetical protein
MNATSDTASTISDSQVGWPLAGTLLPHARLSWDEWVIRMSKEPATVSLTAVRTVSGEPDFIRYLEQYATTTTLPAWPLPATGLPGFRIRWCDWVEMLNGTASSQPSHAQENPSRAA